MYFLILKMSRTFVQNRKKLPVRHFQDMRFERNIFPFAIKNSPRKLNAVGNIPLGKHQGFTRNPNDPFIGTTTGTWWQPSRCVGNIGTNQGEITIGEFKDVRAPTTADGLCSVLVRIGAEPAKKHGLHIHVV